MYRPTHNGSTAVRQKLGGICTFLRFSTFRGRARVVPGRGSSCPPLAELGLVGRCVAGDTEGWCMGRAWHGRAVARGRVASDRAESCKCTVLRAERIAPLARERSHGILFKHILYCRCLDTNHTSGEKFTEEWAFYLDFFLPGEMRNYDTQTAVFFSHCRSANRFRARLQSTLPLAGRQRHS